MKEKLTQKDVEKIQQEIDHRKLVVRKEAIEAVKEARAQGDLSENEHRVLIRSLVQMKNKLIQQGRFTDCVDDLILKVLSAPVKRI